jgi:transcriptional regulator with XRE-family HTH domain
MEWVCSLRQRQNLRQEDLSSMSGVPIATLRRFERTGEISLSSLAKIALSLGALDDLDNIFHTSAPTSIREIEELESTPSRQRVRK